MGIPLFIPRRCAPGESGKHLSVSPARPSSSFYSERVCERDGRLVSIRKQEDGIRQRNTKGYGYWTIVFFVEVCGKSCLYFWTTFVDRHNTIDVQKCTLTIPFPVMGWRCVHLLISDSPPSSSLESLISRDPPPPQEEGEVVLEGKNAAGGVT